MPQRTPGQSAFAVARQCFTGIAPVRRSPHSNALGMIDFKEFHLSGKCLNEHRDPYQESHFVSELYKREAGELPSALGLRTYRDAWPS